MKTDHITQTPSYHLFWDNGFCSKEKTDQASKNSFSFKVIFQWFVRLFKIYIGIELKINNIL